MTATQLRFLRKVDFSGDCWIWTGAKTKGYGRFGPAGGSVRAHRYMFLACGFQIPPGMVIDHLCRNRACVNPFHMETVTNRENILRGEGISANNATKTHCKRGHEFTDENTARWIPGKRHCRACVRAYQKERHDRKRR